MANFKEYDSSISEEENFESTITTQHSFSSIITSAIIFLANIIETNVSTSWALKLRQILGFNIVTEMKQRMRFFVNNELGDIILNIASTALILRQSLTVALKQGTPTIILSKITMRQKENIKFNSNLTNSFFMRMRIPFNIPVQNLVLNISATPEVRQYYLLNKYDPDYLVVWDDTYLQDMDYVLV
jgi:hypothetical protein